MANPMSINNLLNSIVPISRFNKGEAGKIFDEVSKSGYKIVVKNNKPACVLITPEVYQELMETIENYELALEADRRMSNGYKDDILSTENVITELGISVDELNGTDVDIEL